MLHSNNNNNNNDKIIIIIIIIIIILMTYSRQMPEAELRGYEIQNIIEYAVKACDRYIYIYISEASRVKHGICSVINSLLRSHAMVKLVR